MYHAAAAAAIVMNYLCDVTFDTTSFCHDILALFEVVIIPYLRVAMAYCNVNLSISKHSALASENLTNNQP